MDAACLPSLTLMRVTTALLNLHERVAAGDLAALAELDALATLLERKPLGCCTSVERERGAASG